MGQHFSLSFPAEKFTLSISFRVDCFLFSQCLSSPLAPSTVLDQTYCTSFFSSYWQGEPEFSRIFGSVYTSKFTGLCHNPSLIIHPLSTATFSTPVIGAQIHRRSLSAGYRPKSRDHDSIIALTGTNFSQVLSSLPHLSFQLLYRGQHALLCYHP